MPKLVIQTHGLGEQVHVLTADRIITIGRADDNAFQIAEASVSGRHCEVQLRGNELFIRDLNSTNGTYIMGRQITEGTLRLGQILRLGQVDLRLQVSVPVAPPTAGSIASLISSSMAAAAAAANARSESKSRSVPAVPPTAPIRRIPPVQPAPPPISAEQKAQKENTPLPLLSTDALRLPESVEARPRKYQVLLVDDSLALIETMASLFSILSNNTWEIHTASTPDRALGILQQTPLDLIALDLSMPLLDGVQLLGIVHRRYPDLKKAILTGDADEDNRTACLAQGADLFIEKPKCKEGLKAIFNMLSDLITWVPNRNGFAGQLRDVSLHDVIQMECLLRNASVLEIRNRQVRGQIYIEHGTILHASTGTLMGEDALYHMLSLAGGEFQSHPFKAPSQRTIHGSWEALLMEAARLRDETAVLLRDDTKTGPKPVARREPQTEPSVAAPAILLNFRH